MKKVEGCCGNFIRLLLGLFNIIFLLLGIALVVLTCLLKWSNVFSKVLNVSAIQTLINLTAVDAVTIALLVIGAFAIVLSLIGLIGTICLNKPFLIVYEIVIIILFLAHLGALIYLLVQGSTIQNQFGQGINATVSAINYPSTTNQNTTQLCNVMFVISDLFQCCGYSGPNDFLDPSNKQKCCQTPTSTAGCGVLAPDKLKTIAINFLVIPSAIILFIEFVQIVAVPILATKIIRSSF